MLALRPEDFLRFADLLRVRSGETVVVRFVEPADADPLQNYFRHLSQRSRHNRLLGAASELPRGELDKILHVGDNNHFAVIAEMKIGGVAAIVGEARYVFNADAGDFEFGLSIDDQWQGHGIGLALLANLECRAAAAGATRMFGETLRSNQQMIGLARKSGYALMPMAADWRQVQFSKVIAIAPQDIPCANWKRAALDAMSSATARAH